MSPYLRSGSTAGSHGSKRAPEGGNDVVPARPPALCARCPAVWSRVEHTQTGPTLTAGVLGRNAATGNSWGEQLFLR